MSDVLLQIQLMVDGTIRMIDAKGNPLPTISQEEFSTKTADKAIKKAHSLSVLYTNPCGWVFYDGQWYWKCW